MKQRIRKTVAVVWMIMMIGILAGCGKGNNETPATTEESLEAWTEAPTTAAPTTVAPTTVAETTVEPTTALPKMDVPEYRFALLDHAKVGDRYYSSFFLEFDKPGYYISDSTGKSKYFENDNEDIKYSNPVKVFQWIEDVEGDLVDYKVAIIFMSKDEKKVPKQDLSFKVPVRYQYENKETSYVDTMTFKVNSTIAEMGFDNMAPNSPVCLGGHYLGVDNQKIAGTSSGIMASNKDRAYTTMEFSFIRLSFENFDMKELQGHLALAHYDAKTKSFKTYTAPEGFEPYITDREAMDNNLRYIQIGIGLSYPKGTKTNFDFKKEIGNNMVLVYLEDGQIVYYAYFK